MTETPKDLQPIRVCPSVLYAPATKNGQPFMEYLMNLPGYCIIPGEKVMEAIKEMNGDPTAFYKESWQ